jgi:UDP-N-acetylglucosamine 4,6-dehydratase/5-epimerase
MISKSKKFMINPTIKKELKNKTILITGGAGSVGSALTKTILNYPVKSIRIFDINEYALFSLGRSIKDSRLRLLLGNILDKDRLELACKNVDIVFHTAAIKNIEISEYNPIETIDVNINGTMNLIKSILHNEPKKFVNISTDKAANPSTLYGSTKRLGEHLTTWAGKHTQSKTKFSSVRFGNIFETRGNVFEVWNQELKNNTPLSITDKNMTRYFFHIDDAINFVLECMLLTNKGEIFVPKMKSYNIQSLANKISKNQKVIGLRKGEKLDEELLTNDELKNSIEKRNMWIIK